MRLPRDRRENDRRKKTGPQAGFFSADAEAYWLAPEAGAAVAAEAADATAAAASLAAAVADEAAAEASLAAPATAEAAVEAAAAASLAADEAA
ncbi:MULTISPECIES: hypothetical protein [unclassified Burkholderia]|uniref:hypothetical protein n=1 Tax=unclassified Burkholderia TaxID=2613784 RepID=UPI00197E97B6|nr:MULTISPECIES: hypothetical protein [unclassified Burkholderia]MBN3772726.1 hypothetical protein [Burkholderia sp. Se-20378]MBN3795787.1 hypothetical protein [Burkholderia sp. Ac-20392]